MGKVFAWNEWEAHTSCVSEAQKYQGNLYQAKENENKGQKKQGAWLDNVRKKIEDPGSTIPSQVKSSLEKLLGFDNIPRKQKPFGNFVKNSLKIWDERRISEIWDVINAANKPPIKAVAAVCPPCTLATPEAAAKPWNGWKRALDEELSVAPKGELPWKRLRDAVVARAEAANAEGKAASLAELQSQALANIPNDYLSKEDAMVRLPQKS